jgi:hypothetical protein
MQKEQFYENKRENNTEEISWEPHKLNEEFNIFIAHALADRIYDNSYVVIVSYQSLTSASKLA